MHYLVADEAGSKRKKWQCIATCLLEVGEYGVINDALLSEFSDQELSLSRAKKTALYIDVAKTYLSRYFELLSESDGMLVVVIGKSGKMLYHDMYEEAFLLAQSAAHDEITLMPDENVALEWKKQKKAMTEYSIVGIQEQGINENISMHVVELVAGLTIFLQEHYGDYQRRKKAKASKNEDSENTVHMKCELVEHLFAQIQQWYGEVTIQETGLWSVDSDKVMLLEY